MIKINYEGNKEVFCWIDPDDIEQSAMDQINNMVSHPCLYKHVSIMPDVHTGYGATIGSVLPMDGVVIPNAVGYDIGCGMCAVKTNLKIADKFNNQHLEIFHEKVTERIPVGFNHRTKSQYKDVHQYGNKQIIEAIRGHSPLTDKNIFAQLGTLGGGNHFIELQTDQEGFIWVMIHSGSRNIGHTIADFHIKVAKKLMAMYRIDVPKDLDYLPDGSPEGREYISHMSFALDFARENRFIMMEIAKDVLLSIIKEAGKGWSNFGPIINIHHNYAALENHFGKNVWIHRKGATRIRPNIVGIIPGSMGSKSYIVKGKENDDTKMAYHSCSHGAGRTMSRKKAKASITMDGFKDQMQGVFSKDVNEGHLDESPDAYKDISKVMENQSNLVEILHELTPILNIKG